MQWSKSSGKGQFTFESKHYKPQLGLLALTSAVPQWVAVVGGRDGKIAEDAQMLYIAFFFSSVSFDNRKHMKSQLWIKTIFLSIMSSVWVFFFIFYEAMQFASQCGPTAKSNLLMFWFKTVWLRQANRRELQFLA